MTNTFTNRENSFEALFSTNERLLFRAEARAAKLFGLWAAEKLGLQGDQAAAYASVVVETNLEKAGFADVLHKVEHDLTAKGIPVHHAVMKDQMAQFFAHAKQQVVAELDKAAS